MNLSKKNIKSIGTALCALFFLATSTNSFGQTLNVARYGFGAFDNFSVTSNTPYTTVSYTNTLLTKTYTYEK